MLTMDDFSHVSDHRLRSVLAHRLGIRRGRLLPARTDLDPASMRSALPHVWLCDYISATDRFRYRLVGEEVNALHGTNLAGNDLEVAPAPGGVDEALARYRLMVREPMIIHMAGKLELTDGRLLDGERIVMPLGADGRTVDTLLGTVVCDWRAGGTGVISREAVVRTMTPLKDGENVMDEDRRVARQVRITGRVQGVWFRQWTVQQAGQQGLDGWVRNRADGSVEAVFAGEPASVDELIRRCHEGPSAARVQQVTVSAVDDPGPIGFEQRPTA